MKNKERESELVTAQLVGEQTAAYAKNEAIDANNFSIFFADKEVVVKDGELLIEGYELGELPKKVGVYNVLMSKNLLQRLKSEYPHYEFSVSAVRNGWAIYRIV